MKRKVIIASSVLLFLISSKLLAQNFWVPDANFRNALKTMYPTCFTVQDSLITNCSAIQNVIVLNIYNQNISNIVGIEFFTSLQYLHCDDNFLTSFPTLPPALQQLTCTNNLLSSISILSPNLSDLSLYDNLLTSISSLPPNLKNLGLGNNLLTSLPMLPDSLEFLDINQNNFTICPTLPNSLSYFDIVLNQITNLPTLPDSLKALNCAFNLLTSLPALPTSLEQLNCISNPITCFPLLPINLLSLQYALTSITCFPNFVSNLTSCYPSFPGLCDSTTFCPPLTTRDQHKEQKVEIFPNPTQDKIHLSKKNGSALGKVELISSLGEVLETRILSTPVSEWQVEQLADGFYLIKGENWMEKILKKNSE